MISFICCFTYYVSMVIHILEKIANIINMKQCGWILPKSTKKTDTKHYLHYLRGSKHLTAPGNQTTAGALHSKWLKNRFPSSMKSSWNRSWLPRPTVAPFSSFAKNPFVFLPKKSFDRGNPSVSKVFTPKNWWHVLMLDYWTHEGMVGVSQSPKLFGVGPPGR